MSKTQHKPVILVVDDQPENIDVLSSILRSDYKVKAATNGEKALQIALQKDLPDLIMLDVMMPGIDGYEVCRRLKQDERAGDVPVIFVTALQGEKDREMATISGGVDYINKPVKPEEVRVKVSRYLK